MPALGLECLSPLVDPSPIFGGFLVEATPQTTPQSAVVLVEALPLTKERLPGPLEFLPHLGRLDVHIQLSRRRVDSFQLGLDDSRRVDERADLVEIGHAR